jgi:hypothetical protein
MSKAAEALMTARNRHQDLRDQFLARWNNWTYRDWRTGKQIAMELPGSWRTSIDRILDAGLPIEILCECVDTAMGTKGVKDEFRYMCGIAWNKVQALIEIASALNESAEDD